MFNLKNTSIYHQLLNMVNISGQVHVDNLEIANDLKSYARISRGLNLESSEQNGNILITISK